MNKYYYGTYLMCSGLLFTVDEIIIDYKMLLIPINFGGDYMDKLRAVSMLASGEYTVNIGSSARCTLLSKDTIIMELNIAEQSEIYIEDCIIVKDCIINRGNVTGILNSRFSVFNRLGLKEYLKSIGMRTKIDLLRLTHGVSLSDCLWVRFDGEDLSWKDINPFSEEHKFDINWLIDKGNPLLHLVLPNYSSGGQFAKCWFTTGGVHKLIKCGSSGAYNAGLEPLSEVIFTQIADAIGLSNYVKYDYYFVDYAGTEYAYKQSGLLHETIGANNKRLCSICNCVANENTALISAKELGITSYADCLRFARHNVLNHSDLAKILLCDCIGYNEDRHFGNISFEYNPDTMEILSVAPMYDNNLSLLCYWEDRVDLYSYVGELRARDGSKFCDLAEYVFNEYPALFHKVKSADIQLTSGIVKSNRMNILNEVINKNVNSLLLL